MKVTAASHPLIFKACELMMADNGHFSRHDPPFPRGQAVIDLPGLTPEAAVAAEFQLKHLPEDELETFAIGEVTDMFEIVELYPGLAKLNDALDAWFQGGMEII